MNPNNNLRRSAYWLLPLVALLLLWIGRGRFRQWSLGQLRRVRRDSHRIRTAQGTVEYQFVGEGPVVLVVHGAPGGSDNWRIFAPLLDMGFSLLSPSRPGYLGTPLRSGRTFAQQADLLAALLDTLNISAVDVIGHSMGGPVALAFAQRHPTRVRRLVLLSAITHPHAVADAIEEVIVGTSWLPHQLQSAAFWLSHRVLHYFPHVAVRTAVWANYNGPHAEDCIDAILASSAQRRHLQAAFDGSVPLRHRQRGYDNDIRQLRQLPYFPFERINKPTLIIHSRYDASVSVQHAQFASAHLPDVRLILGEGCGHLLLFGPEAPEIVQRLTQFLAEPTPGSAL